jgi:HTH-type transcriptional regulator/antitoxin HipB
MITEALIDTEALAQLIKARRRALRMRQPDLALVADVGVRFIVELENAKPTCQVGRVLRVLQALGITLQASYGAPTVSDAPEADDGLEG